MQNRVQLYTQEGTLLMYMGSAQGVGPGMFSGLQYITIDKNNRVFTSEVYPGRVQEFLYITQEEAQKEFRRREAEKNKSTESQPAPAGQPAASPSPEKPNDKGDAAKPKEPA